MLRTGSILKVRIDGEVTSCIIISGRIKRKTIWAGTYYLSQDTRFIEDENHTIESLDVGLMHISDCFELLIGDKKVWALYYEPLSEHYEPKDIQTG